MASNPLAVLMVTVVGVNVHEPAGLNDVLSRHQNNITHEIN